jgi:hydrogenase maturation protein HypF
VVRLAQKQGFQSTVIQRIHIAIRGAVQGVGFRPFVYRLASDLGLPGWVINSAQGVFIEAEGKKEVLEELLLRLEREKPPLASIQSLEFSFLDPVGFTAFEIRVSDAEGDKTTLVLPDIAVCSDCLREIFDPSDRRYRYPFTNCTNCGPRFSIIEALPYDRANTSMRLFDMCPECRQEYDDPLNRRFHAQPNACPACGPQLELWDESGKVLAARHGALLAVAESIRAGRIAAVKGLGGFHLLVDATNDAAVVRLRERKHREEKPLALMYPSLDRVRSECEVSKLEARLLASPEAPIALLRRRNASVAASVAPRNPYLGVMLPYTPLHHLLMRELGIPVVATSGNLSDEPICTDEREALVRLRGIADIFLVHNRPIVRHVDDSIARILLGRELVLRRARGYAPLPIRMAKPLSGILAVGAHLKNTIALTVGSNVFISQHIGDLENNEASEAFRKVISSFRNLYDTDPVAIAADMHPDYLSTRYAQSCGPPVTAIQHHHAHVAACMAENELEGSVLGVSWDGTGFGPDGTVWGGEFLLTNDASFRRIATFRRFRLPGGERAIREPRRTALGLLYEIFGDSLFGRLDLAPLGAFGIRELGTIKQMLAKSINSPWTSSAGRLFDAVASLLAVRQRVDFEGQAAMELEFALDQGKSDDAYPFEIQQGFCAGDDGKLLVVDWAPIVLALLDDVSKNISIGQISRRFHNTLSEIIVAVARDVEERRIVLTGGCFQNQYLTERTVHRLQSEGFRPYWHQRVPPNDGGIALGQAVIAAKLMGKENHHKGTRTQ